MWLDSRCFYTRHENLPDAQVAPLLRIYSAIIQIRWCFQTVFVVAAVIPTKSSLNRLFAIIVK